MNSECPELFAICRYFRLFLNLVLKFPMPRTKLALRMSERCLWLSVGFVGVWPDTDSETMGELYSSSGSEHEPDSICLQDMVHAFMHQQQQEQGEAEAASCSMESRPNEDCLAVVACQEQTRILKGVLRDCEEAELGVLVHVTTFLQTNGQQQPTSTLQRSLMTHLRSRGYDAAICKSQPTHHKKFPPGKYEYMDVVLNTRNNTRLVVDIDFRAQFEIARPTKEYAALLQALPPVYVGNSDRLLQIVKIMTDSVKISLEAKRMHIPPWRTDTYMLSKWLGSYKRTTNCSSSSDEQKGVREGTPFPTHAWKPCHGGEEKKLLSRLSSIRSKMSGRELSGLCGKKLHPQLAVA